jgi:hypothetical protein
MPWVDILTTNRLPAALRASPTLHVVGSLSSLQLLLTTNSHLTHPRCVTLQVAGSVTSLQLELLMLPRGAQLHALAALTRLTRLALSGSSSKAALAEEHTLALAALTGEWRRGGDGAAFGGGDGGGDGGGAGDGGFDR